MYTCRVRDRIMIAHSFKGDVFGPAQRLHGSTFVVDVTFRREELDENAIVVDIGRATETLGAILSEINYRNLDDLPSFAGRNTTTEFIARWVWDKMKEALRGDRLGPGADKIVHLAVEIAESDIAWAGFEGPVA